jgi:hypothetical protein
VRFAAGCIIVILWKSWLVVCFIFLLLSIECFVGNAIRGGLSKGGLKLGNQGLGMNGVNVVSVQ